MMNELDTAFNEWIKVSPSEDEKREVLDILNKKKDETFRELKSIRDHEKDEVASLQTRLNLLRGEKVGKSATDSSTGEGAVMKAVKTLTIKRTLVIKEIKEKKRKSAVVQEKENGSAEGKVGNAVLEKEDSDLLLDIMKVVFEFVRKEQEEQIKNITELLHMEKQDERSIRSLQQSLGYDIEKVLLKTFFDEIWLKNICTPRSSSALSPYLNDIKENGDSAMETFLFSCIQLVWRMLLESPPLEFCWGKAHYESHYRYSRGEKGRFLESDRIIIPAIVVKQQNGELKNSIKGILQSENCLEENRRLSTAI